MKKHPDEMRKLHFTIDNTCYPWFAYKGSRFSSTESHLCYTDTESKLIRDREPCENAEYDRLMLVAQAAESFDESHKPGSFGFHEALDRTYLVTEHWESFIMGHPSVFLDAELYHAANAILTEISKFYNTVAEKHL